MEWTTPFPEPASAKLDRFAVRSRTEIFALVRELVARGQPMTAFAGADVAGFVLRPVACDEASGRIAFAPDASTMPPAPASNQLILVGFLDGVKLQFAARDPRWSGSGTAGLEIAVPEICYRIERRRFDRHACAGGQRAVCRIPRADGTGFDVLAVLDLSGGGVALAAPSGWSEIGVGEYRHGCRLDLPGVGGVTVTLRARHQASSPMASGGLSRIGFEFAALSPAAERALARFKRETGRSSAFAQGGDRKAGWSSN